jgi:S-methylmethionine-dependent homocysteine/selenocysteine methylase
MNADEAERYHSAQVETFADTAADLVSALTMTYAEESTARTRPTSSTSSSLSRGRASGSAACGRTLRR